MGFNLNFSFGNNAPQIVERDLSGNFFYELINQNANVSKFKSDKEKLNVILSNPAVLKVFALNCDLFSLGKINTPTETDFLYSQRKKPNSSPSDSHHVHCCRGDGHLVEKDGL